MTTEEGVRLLLRGCSNSDIQARHRVVAASIVERLGSLALAIDQAAAYIMYKRILLDRLEDFLTTYESERKKILSHTPKKFWEYEHINAINAFTTWELSFQQLVSGDEPWKQYAAHFLTLSAFFAPTKIAESLFRYYHAMDGSEVTWIQMFTTADGIQDDNDKDDEEDEDHEGHNDVEEGEEKKDGEDKDKDDEDDRANSQSSGQSFNNTWDPDRFWDVIAKSDELSLLQSISQGTGEDGAHFSLHPLIRDWLQLRLKIEDRAKRTQEAILVLSWCVQAYEDRSTTWEEKTALITHMDVSLSNDEEFSEPQDRLGHNIANCTTAAWFAYFYKERAQYPTSLSLYRRVLETQSSELSEQHHDTLHSMSAIGRLLSRVGEDEEAERTHQQTLTLRKKELGENHSDTLSSMFNVANLLSKQGKDEEAESIDRQVLTLLKMEHGEEDRPVLLSREYLAQVLSHQNKHEEAERINRETLRLQEAASSKEHPHTLTSMNNLAQILARQQKYDEAEQILQEVLTLQETVLGKDHPDTLQSKGDLIMVLQNQGKHKEAELIAERGATE